jgi:hypothetical protein
VVIDDLLPVSEAAVSSAFFPIYRRGSLLFCRPGENAGNKVRPRRPARHDEIPRRARAVTGMACVAAAGCALVAARAVLSAVLQSAVGCSWCWSSLDIRLVSAQSIERNVPLHTRVRQSAGAHAHTEADKIMVSTEGSREEMWCLEVGIKARGDAGAVADAAVTGRGGQEGTLDLWPMLLEKALAKLFGSYESQVEGPL